MSLKVVALDTTPLGLIAQRPGIPIADTCRHLIDDLLNAGIRVVVPEIADYEVRRELIRLKKSEGVARLDAFISAEPDRCLPLTTDMMRLAADLWALARQQGTPTADPKEIDGDVILAAQVLSLGYAPDEIVVATSNAGHLSLFVRAELWNAIQP